jgi:hypothetical protein
LASSPRPVVAAESRRVSKKIAAAQRRRIALVEMMFSILGFNIGSYGMVRLR